MQSFWEAVNEKKKCCEQCGAPLAATDRFCSECGTPAPGPFPASDSPEDAIPQDPASEPPSRETRSCSECGEPLVPDDRFCQECGAAAPRSEGPPPGDSAPRPLAEGSDQPVASGGRRILPLACAGSAILVLAALAFFALKIAGCSPPVPFTGGGEGTTLKLDRQTVAPGENTTVPVWLVQAEGIKSLHFTLSYDPATLELSGEATPGSVAPDATLQVTPGKKPGTLDVIVSHDLGIGGTGALLKIPFKVTADSHTEKPLRISVESAADQTGEKPSIRVINGEIVVGKK